MCWLSEANFAWGTSGHELENRELPWISNGDFRRELAGRAYAQAQNLAPRS